MLNTRTSQMIFSTKKHDEVFEQDTPPLPVNSNPMCV
jgi:hypothetical protein